MAEKIQDWFSQEMNKSNQLLPVTVHESVLMVNPSELLPHSLEGRINS